MIGSYLCGGRMQDFRRLRVWGIAHQLALAAYEMTRVFPPDERYGLSAQIRRAAGSICANIAEGCGRGGPRDFGRFLNIARGSASELEYHIILASDLGLLSKEQFAELTADVTNIKRMLTGLIRKLVEPARPRATRSPSRQDG